jgi:pyrimidine-nucleoside phosphorylase
MRVYDIIRKKRDGLSLDHDEIRFLIQAYLDGDVTDGQMAAFLMAVVIRGMSLEETASLTRVMIESGGILRFEGPVIDKHSTGGVGDKISLVLLPVAVECGLRVPMISGRALGFTGGTLDKLESIPGMRTDLSLDDCRRQVRELGGCFAAQTDELVPADRRLYALRDETATVESLPLIVSSILSKKFAEGISGVVIDVKCGRGAFMRNVDEAHRLSSLLEGVGSIIGTPVKTVMTAMDDPLGWTVGNAREVEEAILTLQGHGPRDCEDLTVRLVAEMLVLGGCVRDVEAGAGYARDALTSGRACERFERIIAAQGGRLDMGSNGFGLPFAPINHPVISVSSGFIAGIDARTVGEALGRIGGGRRRAGDEIDPAAGFVFRKKRGDAISAGDVICDIHAPNEGVAEWAGEALQHAIEISAGPVDPLTVFIE